MTPSEINTILDALCEVAETETMTRFRQGLDVENKLDGGFDPVTLADRGAERAIRNWLGEHHPGHGIVGEEEGPYQADAEYCWIIDPVDGTRSFISGLPAWGTLIGLYRNGKPLAGVMHQPFTGEKFIATGAGCRLERAGSSIALATSGVRSIERAIVMTTSPDIFSMAEKPAWERIRQRARLVRYGFDCYAYCMVAAGHVDMVIESGLNAYDIAALIPIIEQAGGAVSTWDGGSPAHGGRIIAAANADLIEEALPLLAV